MDEVQIDVEDRRAARLLGDDVRVPDLVEQRARLHRYLTAEPPRRRRLVRGRPSRANMRLSAREVRLDAGDDDVGVGAVAAPDGASTESRCGLSARAPCASRADAHGDLAERVDALGHRAHAVLDERRRRGARARRWRLIRRVDRPGADGGGDAARCRRGRAAAPSRSACAACRSRPADLRARRDRRARGRRSAPTSASSSASVTSLRRSAMRLKRANAASSALVVEHVAELARAARAKRVRAPSACRARAASRRRRRSRAA